MGFLESARDRPHRRVRIRAQFSIFYFPDRNGRGAYPVAQRPSPDGNRCAETQRTRTSSKIPDAALAPADRAGWHRLSVSTYLGLTAGSGSQRFRRRPIPRRSLDLRISLVMAGGRVRRTNRSTSTRKGRGECVTHAESEAAIHRSLNRLRRTDENRCRCA